MAPPTSQSPDSESKQKVRVALNSANKLVVRDVPNIIVLVGGTVDPGNMDTAARSASFHDPKLASSAHDPNWYWQDNRPFREALDALRKDYTNLHLFTMHGWSGDNNPDNRTIAGRYLADRLCGGGGEKPYYAAFLNREVSIHLIGHSHGGNVINEFTERAATSKEWPKKWKIRSITYLSTPFFTKMHPVKTGAFSDACHITNVFCKYDLTQRVVADFSLMPLHDVLRQKGNSDALMKEVHGLHFDMGKLNAALMSTRPVDKDDRFWHIDLHLLMDKVKAEQLYDESLTAIAQLRKVFDAVRGLLRQFNTPLQFPVATELKGKLTHERKVLSDSLLARFLAELKTVEKGIDPTEKALRARRKKGEYPVGGLFDDLHLADFLQPLVRLIGVDRKTLNGPLWALIGSMLEEQVAEFDNTVTSPAAQLKATKFATAITQVDVSKEDGYSHRHKDVEFGRFISRLEGIEKRYAVAPALRNPRDLRDLLFTLLAQVEPLRLLVQKWASAADWAASLATYGSKTKSPGLRVLIDLVNHLESYFVIVSERSAGGLQVDQPKVDPPYGSLDYLMRVSHSVSRQDLYPPVKEALKKQLDTRLKRG
ncbi:hypothetical protein KRR26_07550 [Corallococcus sp. M34]|uniref:hypothetical protein n=1 Tax=Citreicoccus inhibens TaxID=2849499 RepID=UPI001C2331CB|nr:hypothetical protein [Citreicoccus inhibens]MBU8895454.1 hypothetical protein [Citreicoccus inhibens]